MNCLTYELYAFDDAVRAREVLNRDKEAILVHAATASGAQRFGREADEIEAWIVKRQQPGRIPRADATALSELQATLALTRVQASIRADIDREVIRRLKYERTGTFAGAHVPECVPAEAR